MLERPPALGQQREAALAQAAHRAQQRVPGPGINVQLFDPDRLLCRDVNSVTSTFVAGISQHRHGVQERPQHAQDILPGGGQVMNIARKHIRNPQRDPRRVKQRLDVRAEIMGLPRVPHVDRLPLAADGFLPAPVRVHDLAVQDQVRRALGQGALQRLGQARRARRDHLDHLIEVPVPPWTAAARSPGPAAGYRPCPGTRPARTAPAGNSPACGFPSASRSGGGERPAARKRTGSGPWERRA